LILRGAEKRRRDANGLANISGEDAVDPAVGPRRPDPRPAVWRDRGVARGTRLDEAGAMRSFTMMLLVLAAAACGSKDDNKGGGGGASKTTDKADKPAAPPAAKLSWKKLGGLGLEAEVPEDANIDDNTKGAGFPTATIWASPTMFVHGTGDMSDLKPTIDDTKKQLAKDPNKLKSFTKEEKTADGWVLLLAREAMTGGELLGISVRRTIDGKPFDCGTNARTEDERAKVLKICQSLRAAK
jgi:hypothetical protein